MTVGVEDYKPSGAIHFIIGDSTEVLRISKEGITANPDVPVDEIASKVLELLEQNIRVLVQRAVEAERNKVAQWIMARGYSTGHGDTLDDLLKELELTVREEERELCAQICEQIADAPSNMVLGVALDCAAAIRARGEKK